MSDAPRRFERYVAIGDSSTEGMEDPDGRGGYRGWANRLAERIAREQGSLLYANLAIRGRRTRRIRDEQLEPALAMRPDLVTLFAGTNDAVARVFDVEAVAADLETMQRELIAAGATVLGFTMPDLGPVMPLGKLLQPRIDALNEMLRSVAGATGALLVEFAGDSEASDPRIWSDDRFHANALGHARIAAALAEFLGYPDDLGVLAEPLPPRASKGPVGRLAEQATWFGRYFVPWIWRHARGHSSGDGRTPKRPRLAPVNGGRSPGLPGPPDRASEPPVSETASPAGRRPD